MKIKTKLTSSLKATMLLLAILCLPTNAFAYDFQVDGIYYSINEDDSTTVSVASGEEYYDEETEEYVQIHHNVSGNVTIPASVTYNGFTYTVTGIERYAFSGIEALTDISIPETVTEIGRCAFEETGLWERQHGIVYADKWVVGCKDDQPGDSTIQEGTIGIADYSFCAMYNYVPFINVVIPNSVLYIGSYAFAPPIMNTVTSTKSITIGKNVKHIGYGAFYTGSYDSDYGSYGDVVLEEIKCLANTPPETLHGEGRGWVSWGGELPYTTFSGAFSGEKVYEERDGGEVWFIHDSDLSIYGKVTLYVPRGSAHAYREAADWNQFKTIVGTYFPDHCDVNGDDEVTVSDINEVVDVITQGTSHPNYTNCDVNEDGEVSVADINSIINAIVGD